MYNENIKNRYIENKESEVIVPKGYLQNCFKKSEPFEEELGKDISNFTAYEINNFFKTLNISSYESLLVLCNSFQQYTQWCLQQNLVKDSQNHFLEFDKDDLIACLNKIAMQNKIIPKETIYGWCNELVNYGDSFAIIALFEGLKGKNYCEIVNAKICTGCFGCASFACNRQRPFASGCHQPCQHSPSRSQAIYDPPSPSRLGEVGSEDGRSR